MTALLASIARRRTLGTAAMMAPILIVFAIVYVAPLLSLVGDSFRDADGFTTAHYLEELSSPAFIQIMLRTIWLSLVVTALCLLLGYPVAYTISRLKGQLAAGLLLLISVPYVTSILIRTYAWIVVLSPNGIVNQALKAIGLIDTPLPLVFNSFGVYVGMVQVQLPLMIFPLYAAMVRIDRSYISAARNLGSSPAGAFFQVFAPLTVPGMIGGVTLVFLSCLGFYVTPALLGGTSDYLLSQGISVRVMRLADFAAAATQATILLVIVLAIFVAFRKRLAAELIDTIPSSSHAAGNGLKHLGVPRPLRRAAEIFAEALSVIRRPLLWAITGLVLVFLVAPLVVVVILAFSSGAYLTFPPTGYSLRWFESFFSDRQWIEATWFSLRMGGFAALLSLTVGVPAAFAIVRHRMPFRLPAYLLLISPLVVPQVVVAVALYFVMAKVRLVGTELGFVLAYLILGVPYVIVVFIAGLKRFDRSLEMAASGLGAGTPTILRTITLPLLLPTVASAFLFAFIVAFDDVVFGLFLAGRGATPLPIRMWDDIRLEISPQIAVVAVLMFAALAVFYVLQLVVSLLFRHRRLSSGASAK